jgi:uncharacterized damage-inducible protein DinB
MDAHSHFVLLTRYNIWATHHRDQITAALTMLGQPCPMLDLEYVWQEEGKA